MTAYEDHGVRQEVMDRGAVAFLQKRVDEGTLLAAIQKASERRRKGGTKLDGEVTARRPKFKEGCYEHLSSS